MADEDYMYGRPLPPLPTGALTPTLPQTSDDEPSSTDDENDVAPVPSISTLNKVVAPNANPAEPLSSTAPHANHTDPFRRPSGAPNAEGSTSKDPALAAVLAGIELGPTTRESVPQQRRAIPLFGVTALEGKDPGVAGMQLPLEAQPTSTTLREVPEMPASSDGASSRSVNTNLTLSDPEIPRHSDDPMAWRCEPSGAAADVHRRHASHDSAGSGSSPPDHMGYRQHQTQSPSLRLGRTQLPGHQPFEPEPEPELGLKALPTVSQWTREPIQQQSLHSREHPSETAAPNKSASEWISVTTELDEWVVLMRGETEWKHRVSTCATQLCSALSERRREAQRELHSMMASMLRQLRSRHAQDAAAHDCQPEDAGGGTDTPIYAKHRGCSFVVGPPADDDGVSFSWLPLRQICAGLLRRSILPIYAPSGQLVSVAEKAQALALLEGLCILVPNAATVILQEFNGVQPSNAAPRPPEHSAQSKNNATCKKSGENGSAVASTGTVCCHEDGVSVSHDGHLAEDLDATLKPLVQLLLTLSPDSIEPGPAGPSVDIAVDDGGDARIGVCDLLAAIVSRGLLEPAVLGAVRAAADSSRRHGVGQTSTTKSCDTDNYSDMDMLPMLPLVARLYRAENEDDGVGPLLQRSAQVLLLSLLSLAQVVREEEEQEHEDEENAEKHGHAEQELQARAPPTLHQAIVESIGFEEVERLRAFLERGRTQVEDNSTSTGETNNLQQSPAQNHNQSIFSDLPLPVPPFTPVRRSGRQKQHERALARSHAAMAKRRSRLELGQASGLADGAALLQTRSRTATGVPIAEQTHVGKGGTSGVATGATGTQAAIVVQKMYRGMLVRRRYWESVEAEVAALEEEIAVAEQPPSSGSETQIRLQAQADIGAKVVPRQQRDGATSHDPRVTPSRSASLESWLGDSAAAAAAAAAADAHVRSPDDAAGGVSTLESTTTDGSLERTDSLHAHVHVQLGEDLAPAAANDNAEAKLGAAADSKPLHSGRDIGSDGEGENGRDLSGSDGTTAINPDDLSMKLAGLQERLALLMKEPKKRVESLTAGPARLHADADSQFTDSSSAAAPAPAAPAAAATPTPLRSGSVSATPPHPPLPMFEDEV